MMESLLPIMSYEANIGNGRCSGSGRKVAAFELILHFVSYVLKCVVSSLLFIRIHILQHS
jgi:hypothetical protein